MISLDFYTVMWRDLIVLKRRLWKYIFSRLVSPLLYLVAFGWGLGKSINFEDGSYLQFIVPGIIALSSMTSSFSVVGSSLNMSRLYHRTFEEYLIAPIASTSFVLGKVLAGTVQGFISTLVIIALAFAFQATIILNLWFFIFIFLNCFLFASMGAVAAMLLNSHEDMSNFTTYVILPMTFLSGTFFSTRALPRVLESIVQLLPLTHTSLGLRTIAAGELFPALSLFLLIIYSLVFFTGAVILVERVRS